ncbi:hypothetical protein BBEV_0375 [Salisediminibacterium beveridgei]|uniref:Uncharacterized protein n=1 Tax=Salisediminibacterium beveridgei TaxID=632773 RepID=A0A1D7QRZ7_9BACI|nr:hypothetical protein BBEV_0375 [Salisediminibacterium beveridgei]
MTKTQGFLTAFIRSKLPKWQAFLYKKSTLPMPNANNTNGFRSSVQNIATIYERIQFVSAFFFV